MRIGWLPGQTTKSCLLYGTDIVYQVAALYSALATNQPGCYVPGTRIGWLPGHTTKSCLLFRTDFIYQVAALRRALKASMAGFTLQAKPTSFIKWQRYT